MGAVTDLRGHGDHDAAFADYGDDPQQTTSLR